MTCWKMACSYNARSQAQVLRLCLEKLGYTFTREEGQRHFSRFSFVITLDRFARVLRFEVTEPVVLTLESWDEVPGHGGKLSYLEASGFDYGERASVTRLLSTFAASLPRPPWKFTLGQKLGVGLLNLDIARARSRWARAGVSTESLLGAPRVKLPVEGWLPAPALGELVAGKAEPAPAREGEPLPEEPDEPGVPDESDAPPEG